MNTFLLEKIGEVIGFARVGTDTLAKGHKGLQKLSRGKDFEKMGKVFVELELKLSFIALGEKAEAVVEKQALATEKKVAKMRDTYIANKWEDQDELLEWMGFYAGACLVHWKLISGAAATLKSKPLIAISKRAITFYTTLFVLDEKVLKKIGASNV